MSFCAAPRFSPRPAQDRPGGRYGGAAAASAPGHDGASLHYIPEWAGFYLGVHGGGWDHGSFDSPFLGIPIPGVTASGAVFGGHARYNWQYGLAVGGLEVDFDGADIKQTSPFVPGTRITTENKIDNLASVRARLGYALLPNLLAYGTAGVGFGHARFAATIPAIAFSGQAFVNEIGWVAGVGVEYRLFERLLLRAEYLHYDFGQGTAGLSLPVNIRERVDVVRGGITYKF